MHKNKHKFNPKHQIFEAPRRGLINGSLGLNEGVDKGFGTFITTVISISLDIVGKYCCIINFL